MAGLVAVAFAVVTAGLHAREYVFPTFAPTLIPAIFGVFYGIWIAGDRLKAAAGKEESPPKNPPLKAAVVGALLGSATVLAVGEQQVAVHLYPEAAVWMRVVILVVLIIFGVSELGPRVFAGGTATIDNGQAGGREQP
jgi:hypothetical protein